MGDEWRERPFGELVTSYDELRVPVKEADRRPGPYPYYGASGIVDYVDSYRFDGEYLLVAEDGENLRTRKTPVAFMARGRFWVNNHAHVVMANPEADTRFLMYALSVADIDAFLSGSTMPKLTQGNLHRIPLRVPSRAVQAQVARILGAFDDKIELNRKMSETLEAMARALFRSWFVDFDPVRAKAEGRDTGLPKEIADLFPDSFEDSELGEIPTGWGCSALPGVVTINPPRSLRKGTLAPYLDMANMPTSGHSPENVVPREYTSGMRFTNGDTLVARITPCLENGKAAFVDFLEDGEIGWGSTEFIVMRPVPSIPPAYAYCLARSPVFREFLIQSMTGSSGRQRVQTDALDRFLVATPPAAVAAAFGSVAGPLFAKGSAALNESHALMGIRDSLLPRLVSGQLRVGANGRTLGCVT